MADKYDNFLDNARATLLLPFDVLGGALDAVRGEDVTVVEDSPTSWVLVGLLVLVVLAIVWAVGRKGKR